MELFGMPITTVYLVVLGVSGILVLIYVLFGDFLDGMDEGIPFLNPTLILVFFIFLSAAGYILELITKIPSIWILILSAAGSFILTTLLYLFVLVPLSSAEESLAFTDESLKGRLGNVIIPIPEDGYGEVLIENVSGRIARSAASFDGSAIPENVRVMVIDVKQGVLYVRPYDEKAVYRVT